MGAGAGLRADQADGLLPEDSQDPGAADMLAQRDFPVRVHAVQTEGVLCQADSNRSMFMSDSSCSVD